MYVALFLTPWMLMYAIGTIGMNHYALLAELYGEEDQQFKMVAEMPYRRLFPTEATPRIVAERILKDLGMEGGHSVREGDDGEIIVHRGHPIAPRRITYWPEERKLVVEKQVFRTLNFFTRLHTRVGYSSRYWINSAWAATVDLSVLATFFWLFSGFWIWWELKKTRRLGLWVALGGLALFGLFVAVH
jgi:hypothetical protein